MEQIIKFKRLRSCPRQFSRLFSATTHENNEFKMSKDNQDGKTYEEKSKDKSSILHFDNAVKHCTEEVKKFDFYAFVNGQYMPKQV